MSGAMGHLAVVEREAAGDPGPINSGFLDVFIAKVLNPPYGGSIASRERPLPGHWIRRRGL